MKKKILIATGLILLLLVGGYLYVRYHVLSTKDFKPDERKAKSSIDLRPALIAKLQQAVKDGSDGLYRLSIDALDPDITVQTVTAKGVRVDVDTMAYNALIAVHKLPDDIFRGSFAALSITGISLSDLLHRRNISLTSITVQDPKIEAFHCKRAWNAAARARDKNLTLYQKLQKNFDAIAIGRISIEHADFKDHNTTASGTKSMSLNDISIALEDLRIDSATQYDEHRAFFAKRALLTTGAFSLPTADSQYEMGVGKVIADAAGHTLVIEHIAIKPRGGKKEFMRRQKTRAEMFELHIASLTLSGVNWWAILHREEIIAKEAVISGSNSLYVYLDKTPPESPGIKADNFPQQMLMSQDVPISVAHLRLSGLDVRYEEYDPKVAITGAVSFNKIAGSASNITNRSVDIIHNPLMHFEGACQFMNQTTMKGTFSFQLPKARKGAFTADVEVTAMDHSATDSFAEPMGRIRLDKGRMQQGSAHVEGNDFSIKGNVSMAYTDLHITPLKKEKDEEGNLKGKRVTRIVANAIIKNNNPGADGKLRQPDFQLARGEHGNWFNYSWSGIKLGLLKTIGVPVKFGM